jgi:tRNA1(Val) A37 N6-methylase TrmN6
MYETPPGRRDESAANGQSCDAWLGGRLILQQPRRGHRVGSDAALLAAAARLAEGRLIDVGAGVGAVGLAILSRSERAAADLIEIDPTLAGLAADNAARNGLAARARVVQADILDAGARRAAGLSDETADLVVTNPPFFEPGAVRASPDPGKARAHVLAGNAGGTLLVGWIRACLALLKSGGSFVMIHRPDALAAILRASENRLGALALLPVHPRAGAPAHRLLVSGIKGSKAPLRIASPLALHDADGRLTLEADAIHRGQALIDWGE